MKKTLTILFLLSFTFAGIASAATIGNVIVDRQELDGATNIAFIDPTLVFPTAGIITSWDVWLTANDADQFALQIYRATTDPDSYQLVYNTLFTVHGDSTDSNWNLPPGASDFVAQPGDIVGWWFGAGGGVIPYTYNVSDDVEWTYWASTAITNPNLGDIYSFDTDQWANSSQNREYSIAVNYSPVPEPATLLLFGAGLVGLACARRKLKR